MIRRPNAPNATIAIPRIEVIKPAFVSERRDISILFALRCARLASLNIATTAPTLNSRLATLPLRHADLDLIACNPDFEGINFDLRIVEPSSIVDAESPSMP